MDYVQFITTAGTIVTTAYFLKGSLDKKFDDIRSDIREIRVDIKEVKENIKTNSDRISRVEGELSSIRSILQALVGRPTEQKTGTDGK